MYGHSGLRVCQDLNGIIAMQSAKLAEVDFVHVATTNLLEVEGGCDYRATQVPGWLHRHGGVSD